MVFILPQTSKLRDQQATTIPTFGFESMLWMRFGTIMERCLEVGNRRRQGSVEETKEITMDTRVGIG